MSDWVTAISAVGSAVATFALAGIAWYQLGELRKQLAAQGVQLKTLGDREKQWRTIDACERYTYDPVLRDAKLAIWRARGDGARELIEEPRVVRREVITLLNYLDAVGVGVQQGVYLDGIVRDHLRILIIQTVQRFVKGEWGDFQLDEANLNGLMHLYDSYIRAASSHHSVA